MFWIYILAYLCHASRHNFLIFYHETMTLTLMIAFGITARRASILTCLYNNQQNGKKCDSNMWWYIENRSDKQDYKNLIFFLDNRFRCIYTRSLCKLIQKMFCYKIVTIKIRKEFSFQNVLNFAIWKHLFFVRNFILRKLIRFHSFTIHHTIF